MTRAAPSFAATVVRWQRSAGRHGMPWQASRDPYRVWLSEIMLQQTQVIKVVDYFQRFTARFPTVHSLASASIDQVLGQWSGLGYYRRAHNLHQCAQTVVQHYGGSFPNTAQQLAQLPGIGRSTAAAIAAFCFGERVAILDANVRRVLTRVFAFDGDLAQTEHLNALWDIAESLLPQRNLAENMPSYTQGLMDLGAGVCHARKPDCASCPLRAQCQAYARGNPERFPVVTRKLKRSANALWLLWAQRADGALWLVKRPSIGIWGGLYCFPMFDSAAELIAALTPAQQRNAEHKPAFVHVLTHKDLHLHPVYVPCDALARFDTEGARWIPRQQALAAGLPAPVRSLLESA